MKIKLRGTVIKLRGTVIKFEGNLYVVGKKNYRIPNLQEGDIFVFLDALQEGIEECKLDEYLQNYVYNILFLYLKEMSLLIRVDGAYKETSLEKSYDFLAYHLGDFYSPFAFKKALHIAIIGCGGVGGEVALCLASSGVKKISLVDFDIVQASNLNRQFAYELKDVGKCKVEELRRRLLSINDGLEVKAFNKKICRQEDLGCLPDDIDFVVSAIDCPPVKSSVWCLQYTLEKRLPIIFGAAGYGSIVAGPLLVDEMGKRDFLNALQERECLQAQPISGSLASTNMVLSGIIATNIVAYFYSFAPVDLLGMRKIYDPVSMEILSVHKYGGL